MKIDILAWIAMILSVSGNIFVNFKNQTGMFLWLFGSGIWLYLAVLNNNNQQICLFGIYTLLNIHGIFKWQKKRNK